MSDSDKTRDQLLRELGAALRRIAELEKAEADRRRMEEAQRRTMSLLRATLESTADGILVVDREGKIVDFNARFAQLWRIPDEILATRDDQRAISFVRDQLKAPEAFVAKVEQLYAQPEADSFDVLEFKDGRTFERYSHPQRIDGRPVGRVWSFRDVTEHKRAEQDLRESQARFRELYEDAPVGYHELDTEGRIVRVNRTELAMLGYTAEEMLGRLVWEFTVESDEARESVIERLSGTPHGPTPHERTFRRKGGGLIPVAVQSRILRDAGGRVTGIRVTVQDITEHRRAEEALRALEAERFKMGKVESMGILAGGIAHDFNNLLSVILGNVSFSRIAVGSEDKTTAIERLTEAEKACLRARDLTRQLLTFSKGGAPIKQTGSIAEVLRESARFAVRGADVRCEFYVPDNIWPVDMDKGQISQVVHNLVINAVQAMAKGGAIRVRAENLASWAMPSEPLAIGRYVKVSIEDRGIGVPKDHLAKVFDPYFTTKQEGSGLGLSIAYSIIKRHEGYINLESELGKGTTVTFYLPASTKAVPAAADTGAGIVRGRGTILVMDDEEMIRELLSAMLTELGYRVSLARDGAEAIELYTKAQEAGRPFDAIMLDLTVPGGIGGKEAIQRLFEIDPGVKAIVSSGYSDAPIMFEFRRYGFRGVIAKPYTIEDVSRALHRVLHGA